MLFDKVLFDYLFPRLKYNTHVQQTQARDDEVQVKRLVTSIMIASLAFGHRLMFIEDNVLRDILENLALHGNPILKKCIEFEELLLHFPDKVQRFDIFFIINADYVGSHDSFLCGSMFSFLISFRCNM